jgi:hypothetical protein
MMIIGGEGRVSGSYGFLAEPHQTASKSLPSILSTEEYIQFLPCDQQINVCTSQPAS